MTGETVLDKAARDAAARITPLLGDQAYAHREAAEAIRSAMESLIREAAEVIAHAGDCAEEGGCTHGFGPDPDEARDAVLHWAGLEPKSEREREG